MTALSSRSERASSAAIPAAGSAADAELDVLVRQIRACRLCVEDPRGSPLPHEPRPVLRPSSTARIAVAGQAPGTRVHQSGKPFTDPSGVRLRAWMGVDESEFYDDRRVAILPMGFCFPGLDRHGGDRPPRRECAPRWRNELLARMPQLELILLVGIYAQHWHLPSRPKRPVSDTVQEFEAVLALGRLPRLFPLPHPSWRNNAWIRANPWFETDVLPRLKVEVRRLL